VTVTTTANIAEEGLLPTGGPAINGIETVPITAVTAGFVGGTPGQCTATINWGDGTTSVGMVIGPDMNGGFLLVGQPTYIEDGEVEVDLVDQFTVTTTINCPGMTPATATTTAFIGEEDITPGGRVVITGKETVPLNNVVVATFAGGISSTQGCTVTIDWGDGTTSAGTLSGPNQGIFTITGSHTYIEDGENEQDLVDVFTVKVTINCPSMAPFVIT